MIKGWLRTSNSCASGWVGGDACRWIHPAEEELPAWTWRSVGVVGIAEPSITVSGFECGAGELPGPTEAQVVGPRTMQYPAEEGSPRRHCSPP